MPLNLVGLHLKCWIEKEDLTNVIKPKLEWDRGDNEASENNARAMYFIFNAINTNEFRRIATCI